MLRRKTPATSSYRKNLIVISDGDCLLNFLGRVGQPIRIDVDAHMALRTVHMLARFQAADRLPEVAPAIGALKPELVGISAGHGGMLSVR